jgi:hypothetical protein
MAKETMVTVVKIEGFAVIIPYEKADLFSGAFARRFIQGNPMVPGEIRRSDQPFPAPSRFTVSVWIQDVPKFDELLREFCNTHSCTLNDNR